MKHLKMLGLAAVAAMGLMAFIGAGTASATVLCKTNLTSGCAAAGWDMAATDTLSFSAEGSTFLTGPFGEVVSTCTGSTVAGSITNTGGSAATQTVSGNITSLTFTGCTKTVTTTNTSGSQTTGTLEVHHIAGTDNGTVTSNDTTVTIDNTILGTCHFLTNNTDIGRVTGQQATGGASTFDIEAKIPSENCGFSGQWHGKYVSTGQNFNVAAS